MLKRIELWDYEIHDHIVIDDLSPYLNLIWGKSNCGKSSIVRALRLVAFNQFDPDSVRVGAKYCQVEVESDKGIVKVTRGNKKNIWEVTKFGEPTQTFSAIGRKILPEVEEILGLRLVKLGDIEIAANIMDQLEKHFMLVELEGQKAAGSVRAQIIDEISGLSGIETVIRDVSLDGTRIARNIKQTEEEINENTAKMYDQTELEREQRILNKIAKFLDEADSIRQKIKELQILQNNGQKGQERVAELKANLKQCSDTDKARISLEAASVALQRVTEGKVLLRKLQIKDQITELQKRLFALPEVNSIDIEAIIKCYDKIIVGREFLSEWGIVSQELEKMEKLLASLPKEEVAPQEINDILCKLGEIKVCWGKIQEVSLACAGLRTKVEELQERLAMEIEKLNEILVGIEVCPLTNLPLTESCYEGIKQVKEDYEKSNRS